VDFRDPTNLLPRPVFVILDRNRDKLFIGESPAERSAPELMLRSAIATTAERDTIEYWLEAFRWAPVVAPVDSLFHPARLNDPARRLLSLYELAIVDEWSKSAKPTRAQAEYVLRTQLERGTDDDRDRIYSWTHQVIQA